MPLSASRLAAIVETWFVKHQRRLPWRSGYDPWFVWVSEVMLQQTRMEVVLRYYTTFMRRFPSVAALAVASEDDVLAAWSGLGYYRRARMLREGAQDVVERFGGRIPSTSDELLTISGIGRYTAGAISSIAFGRHAPIVDGNVARILSRLRGIDEPVASPALMRAAWMEEEKLVAAAKSPRDFNQGLMELGALVCKPSNPDCPSCPLRKQCVAFATGRTALLPRSKEKPATRAMIVPLYLITDKKRRVLMRRESGALMRSMFHLPHGDTSLLGGVTIDVRRGELLGTFRHTITNRRIEFQLFAADPTGSVRDTGDEYAWIDPRELSRIPHPSYVAKALAMAAGLQSKPCAGG